MFPFHVVPIDTSINVPRPRPPNSSRALVHCLVNYDANGYSYFQPTCSECSTPFPAPGLLAVRGDAAMASCRECHRKMSTNADLRQPTENMLTC